MNNFIRNLVMKVGAGVMKSVAKAYKQVVGKGKGGQAKSSPFSEQFQKVFVSSGTNTPMTKEEAMLILQYEDKEVNPEAVMARYFTLLDKNREAGSIYLQVKIMSAKNMLMVGHEQLAEQLQAERQAARQKQQEEKEGGPKQGKEGNEGKEGQSKQAEEKPGK